MNPILEVVRGYLNAEDEVMSIRLWGENAQAKFDVTLRDGHVECHEIVFPSARKVRQAWTEMLAVQRIKWQDDFGP